MMPFITHSFVISPLYGFRNGVFTLGGVPVRDDFMLRYRLFGAITTESFPRPIPAATVVRPG